MGPDQNRQRRPRSRSRLLTPGEAGVTVMTKSGVGLAKMASI